MIEIIFLKKQNTYFQKKTYFVCNISVAKDITIQNDFSKRVEANQSESHKYNFITNIYVFFLFEVTLCSLSDK